MRDLIKLKKRIISYKFIFFEKTASRLDFLKLKLEFLLENATFLIKIDLYTVYLKVYFKKVLVVKKSEKTL